MPKRSHIHYSNRIEAAFEIGYYGKVVDEDLYTDQPQNVRKLTVHQAECLRNLRSAGVSYTELGRMFGISKQAARRIGLGETYKHVK